MCFNEKHMKTDHIHVPSIDHKSSNHIHTCTRHAEWLFIDKLWTFSALLLLPLSYRYISNATYMYLMKKNEAASGRWRHIGTHRARVLAHQLELQRHSIVTFDSKGHCPNFHPAMHGGHAMLQQQLKDDIYFIIPPLLIILSYIYYATTWRLF